MTKVSDITSYLEKIAPIALQESYDNAGLLTGNKTTEVTGILITLDITEEVVDEAIRSNCNLIVAHHPIIFKGLKKLTGTNYVERTVIKAIKNDIALYGIHTNLDNISEGVNKKICNILGISNPEILAPKPNTLKKLITFAPVNETQKILSELFTVGAGNIGPYKECSFYLNGKGTFFPEAGSNPSIGNIGERSEVREDRIEVIFNTHLEKSIVHALKKSHSYEVPAFDIVDLSNSNKYIGSGMIGTPHKSLIDIEYLNHVKSSLNLKVLKHTKLFDRKIVKVAVCGGSGSFLLKNAVAAGADIFITSDFKYHEYFDAENNLIIADVGHYESEIFTKELIYDFLIKNFSNIAVILAKTVTNPISYL